ncbi:MAG: alpha/beta hydrolase family protein [Eubacteriales bacterium]|nr:alpha/beta hydrolase family protein [Eubacteriales bacterium]
MARLEFEFYSTALARQVEISCVLPEPRAPYVSSATQAEPQDCRHVRPRPEDYRLSDVERRVPVLYLLHGYQGNRHSWLDHSRIEALAERHGFMAVMPSAENSLYLNSERGRAQYEDYIIYELPDLIEVSFRVARGRQNRFLAGNSMGGFGALRLGLLYPERYTAIAAFSPALMSDAEGRAAFYQSADYAAEISGRLPELETGVREDLDLWNLARNYRSRLASSDEEAVDIYLTCGESDPLFPLVDSYAAELQKIGLKHVYRAGTGAHIYSYWDLELGRFISQMKKWGRL